MSLEVTPRQLLVSQAFIVAYSLLAAVLGRNWVTFAVIILLIIAFTVWQSRRQQPPLGPKAGEEVEKGRVLYEESSTRELQLKDEGLARDFEAQARVMMTLNAVMLVSLAYFFLFWGYLDRLYQLIKSNFVANDVAAHFLAFLIYFEGYFVISTVLRVLALRRAPKLPMVTMPSEYKVTDKGIVYKGLLSWTRIAFPLPEDARVRVDEERRFVEIERERGKSVYVLRLYARNPRRLYQVLTRYGLGSRGGRREGG